MPASPSSVITFGALAREHLGGELAQPLFFDMTGFFRDLGVGVRQIAIHQDSFRCRDSQIQGRKAYACTKVSSAEKCRVMSVTYGTMAVHDGE